MADPQIRAAFYLSPMLAGLWRWSDDGQVLTWPDNSTIAFRGEVDAVLHRLAPGGLPPFGAVALLLAACREGWTQSVGRALIVDRERFCANRSITDENTAARGAPILYAHIAREIRLLIDGLDAINRLPREHLEGMAAKAFLAEVVFEAHRHRGTADDAAMMVHALDGGINPEMLKPQASNEESLQQFAHQVDGLHEGLRRVDAEMLARRARTGLDQSIAPAQEDLAPPDAVRRLLAELYADHELAGLARLAQDLMAAVSVPRTLRTRDELAVGGVSDLSNRGPLDRLLVSELAHDDLTLAVRVAVNEALYLRRESPPREPPHRRAILIDAGLRMWGIPRVFATAVALALAATNDPAAQLAVYRAKRDGIHPVDLTTRAGLESHLGELDTPAHPGGSIAPFFAAITNADAAQTDAVLITHKDVLSDPDFIAAMSEVEYPLMYVAAIDRDGSFSLLAFSKAGRKPVREARLSLDCILGQGAPATEPRAGVPLVNHEVDLSLPAILYSEVFPFYLPHVVDPRLTVVSKKHGLISATQDGRILQWRDGLHGARQLTSLLPRGLVRGVFLNEAMDVAYAVISSRRELIARLIIIDLNVGLVSSRDLMLLDPDLLGVFMRGDVVYIVHGDRVDAFSTAGGMRAGTLALSKETRWDSGRFFRSGSSHFTIALGGSTGLTLERVPVASPSPLTLFDREGIDGTSAIDSHRIFDATGNVQIRFTAPIRKVLGVSPDGHRIVIETANGKLLIDLIKRGESASVGDNYAEELLAPEIHWSTRPPVQPRTKFRGIGLDSQSGLLLYTKDGGAVSISKGMDENLILMKMTRTIAPSERIQEFNQIRRSHGARVSMGVARFWEGGNAWLDSRGILHLKSSDRTIPELSITLSNIACAAWSSEGKITGPARFIGDAPKTSSDYFLKLLGRFSARLR